MIVTVGVETPVAEYPKDWRLLVNVVVSVREIANAVGSPVAWDTV